MAIRIKAARSAKELKDVFELRYQVYVEEEGLFPGIQGDIIVDLFDAVPAVVNLVAYDEETQLPVGTFRVNLEQDIALPSDELFDFNAYRERIRDERRALGLSSPVFGSGGMLAIAKPFRKRRDVFRGLLKMACAVAASWNITHIVATVNATTSKIYRSLGWEFLGDKTWVEAIKGDIVPVATELAKMHQWAFGALEDHHELIDRFSDRFEWLLIGSQSKVFCEGSEGVEAYLVASGLVKITQKEDESKEALSWTTLGRGSIFGEMSLIDDLPRSASATAMANTELVVIGKVDYWEKLKADPAFLRAALKSFSVRLRDAGERAVVYAHGDEETRLNYCLQRVHDDSVALSRAPKPGIVKISLSEFAFMSNVAEERAEAFLRRCEEEGLLVFDTGEIRFLKETRL